MEYLSSQDALVPSQIMGTYTLSQAVLCKLKNAGKTKKRGVLQTIEDVSFDQALEERYLAYALSTIMSRSLPDVRDGFKPVHRRLIYAMQQLKLNPQSPFKKCARIVGDVMGKFHPHGDAAIYGALVRLAQDFSVRYPLIEGQGNFGNIDGDGAAAMRYTEARLSHVALIMMEGLDQNCVDFRPTYDGETVEPLVFPTFFPNLLANGSTGIAVGMATSIPPHNVEEVYKALHYLIDHPKATTRDLMDFIQGPDFPTGGLLMEEKEDLIQAYETGRGSFRLRAHWFVEEQKGGNFKVIIDKIPYMVEKAKLIEKIASLILERKNAFLDDVQDESTEDIRLVLYPKNRNVAPEVLMESLYQQTDLEVRFPLNMNVLNAQNVPGVMSLQEVLQAFVQHTFLVLQRQTQNRLDFIYERLQILQGFLIVYRNLDDVIRIIREEDEPKAVLIQQFELQDNQAESILNMRLRSLRKLQEMEIRKELDDLSQEQDALRDLLTNEGKQRKHLQKTFKDHMKHFGPASPLGPRRTRLCGKAEEIFLPVESFEKEEITLICSQKNWIRAIKGTDTANLKYKEGDQERFLLPCSTADKILVFATNGRAYTLDAHKMTRTKGQGDSLRLLIDIPDGEDVLALHILPLRTAEAEKMEEEAENSPLFFVGSQAGYGFRVSAHHLLTQTKSGRAVLLLKDKERAAFCLPIQDKDTAVLIGTNRKMVAFPLADVPILAKGRGVRLQKYNKGYLSDIQLCRQETGFVWARGGQRHTFTAIQDWMVHRGATGRLPPPLFPRDNLFHN
ncbi:DNA topoisomerase 4 subunit A [Alphaproteobacteria bacterium]|nr:DNA topoisomerase 4 subunit A [Alphaproteobacteria bacterium]GHS95676.1 DNA topoisomerase 4 subunit A [Alphaproteobacteria bacterium]